jgi:hypothetical protein
MAGREKNKGAGEPLNLTVPAGLYDFLSRHAKRAIVGKNEGEIAMHMILSQANAWDQADYLGIRLPSQDFPNPEAES